MFLQKKSLASWLEDRKVLVIEPNSNYRTSIRQYLENLKIKNVKFVFTTHEAKTELITTQVALIICEWKLSPTNGIQFCKEIRKQKKYRNVPFVLISTENLKNDVVLASEVGIDGYLLKPFSYDDFSEHLENLAKKLLNPSDLTNMIAEAKGYIAKKQMTKASRIANEVVAKHPDSAQAYLILAMCSNYDGDSQTAINFLKKAIDINEMFVEAYSYLLDIFLANESKAGVFSTAKKLTDLSPDNPKYNLVLAGAYLDRHEYDLSEEHYKLALKNAPSLVDAYKGLGYVYLKMDELEKAQKTLQKALDLDQTDASILNTIGLCYVRQQQFRKGIEQYRLALKLAPADDRLLFNIGHAYEKIGELESAKEYYSSAVKKNSKYQKAQDGLKRVTRVLKNQTKSA